MNRPDPEVSVLLTVRNGEPYFAAALASILAQDGVDFEVIVIDDGSSDGTPALLQACLDPRLRVIRREGGGLVAALNAALAEARGEYCARMDADDIALPGRFAAQVAVLDQNPEAVLTHSAVEVIDEHDRILGAIAAQPVDQARRRAILLGEETGPPIIHPSVMLRRGALVAAGGYRESPSCEDHDLWLRLVERGPFIAIDRPLLRYRQHALGISRQRMTEQALSNLTNCVAARWRAETGIDLLADDPQTWAALRGEAARQSAGYLTGFEAARRLRMALRRWQVGKAVKAGLALLGNGRLWLLFERPARRDSLRLQHRLAAWLRQRGSANSVAPQAGRAN